MTTVRLPSQLSKMIAGNIISDIAIYRRALENNAVKNLDSSSSLMTALNTHNKTVDLLHDVGPQYLITVYQLSDIALIMKRSTYGGLLYECSVINIDTLSYAHLNSPAGYGTRFLIEYYNTKEGGHNIRWSYVLRDGVAYWYIKQLYFNGLTGAPGQFIEINVRHFYEALATGRQEFSDIRTTVTIVDDELRFGPWNIETIARHIPEITLDFTAPLVLSASDLVLLMNLKL